MPLEERHFITYPLDTNRMTLETVQRRTSTVFWGMNDQSILTGSAILPAPQGLMAFEGYLRPYHMYVPNSEGRAVNKFSEVAGFLVHERPHLSGRTPRQCPPRGAFLRPVGD